MQNLKENWVVLSKMTWEICGKFSRAEKGWFHFRKSKMVELNQNKNLKQPDRPEAVWRLYSTLEINE